MLNMRARVGRAVMVAALIMAGAAGAPAWAQSAASQAAAPPAKVDDLIYILGSGDKVRVTVYDEPSLSGEFEISGNGKASLPLIGEVQASGLALKAFQQEIEKILSDGYLKQPRVSVEVMNYRPFYIMGEVGKPGQYQFNSGLTVLNAVATAGGFTYRANKGRVYIKHNNETAERSYDLEGTTAVAPGDTIRIGERFF